MKDLDKARAAVKLFAEEVVARLEASFPDVTTGICYENSFVTLPTKNKLLSIDEIRVAPI